MNYYIYYRIGVPEQELIVRVRAMQHEIFLATGIQGSLLQQQADPTTWMEIYNDVIDTVAFDAVLDVGVDRFVMSAVLQNGAVRHVEKFKPI